jgi:thiamine-monophosphate kinase
VRRFTRPEARLALGRAIASHASAAIDVSDGLYTDLEKLLAASGVSGIIDIDALPLSSELKQAAGESGALRQALGGGDDYELCFTTAKDGFASSGEVAGVRATRIGTVGKGSGLVCQREGNPYAYHNDGYRHFS